MTEPPSNASPFNDVVTVTLDPGEEAVIGYEPEERRSRFVVPTVLMSKWQLSEYVVELDGVDRFGPASIPPSDIDDDSDTFRPPESFEDRMEVIVSNLSDSTRTYHVQVVGWEERLPVDRQAGRGF